MAHRRGQRFVPVGLLVLSGLWAASCGEPPATPVIAALDVCALSADGALCDDGNICTVSDVCIGKKCVGTAVPDGTPCTDGDVCTIDDVCRALVCAGTPAPDGTPCTDDDLCTSADSCQLGKCQAGPPLSCDDGDPCTVDMCVSPTGCLFSPRDCVAPPDAAGDATIADDGGAVDGLDAAMDDGGTDDGPEAGEPDGGVPPDGGAGSDGGADADGSAEPDAGADGSPVDGAVDGAGDGATSDGGMDASLTPPDLRVRGGACSCSLPDSRSARRREALSTVLALVAAFGACRRRWRPRR
jgi:hypothetical protein